MAILTLAIFNRLASLLVHYHTKLDYIYKERENRLTPIEKVVISQEEVDDLNLPSVIDEWIERLTEYYLIWSC